MARLTRLRAFVAHVVWWFACLLATVLACGALLVALRADPASVWGWWLEAVDLVTVGWFDRGPRPAVGGGDVRGTVVRWGSAAVAVLVLGFLAQWVLRPRSSVR